MAEELEEIDHPQLYVLDLRDGTTIDVLADAADVAYGLMMFYSIENGSPVLLRGINTDEVVTFAVKKYDPEAGEAVTDSAPSIMDSEWGWKPGDYLSEGNPYAQKPEPEIVPDPFRGQLKQKGGA